MDGQTDRQTDGRTDRQKRQIGKEKGDAEYYFNDTFRKEEPSISIMFAILIDKGKLFTRIL